MQRILFIFVFIFLATGATRAQDVIHLMDSTTVSAAVKTIAPRTITYKRSDNPNGPDFVIDVKKVHHISLGNGKEINFDELHPGGMPQPYRTRLQAREYHRHTEPPLQEIFQLKIAPSSLFDPWGMMLPVYAEYDFARHYGIELMAAIPFDHQPLAAIDKKPPIVNRIKQDSKFGFSIVDYIHSWKKGHLYLGVEGNSRHQQLSLGAGEMNGNNSRSLVRSFQSADLSKSYYGGGIKFGITACIAGGLWFDTYLGLGFTGGHSYHTNVQGLNPTYGYDESTYPFNANNITNTAEGTSGVFYIPFALRISYHFDHAKK